MVACTLETLARSARDSPGRHPRARAYVYRHTFSCPRRARLTRRVLIPTRPAGSTPLGIHNGHVLGLRWAPRASGAAHGRHGGAQSPSEWTKCAPGEGVQAKWLLREEV